MNNDLDLSVQIGKLRLKNPVMTASGTFGFGREYAEFIGLERLGAIVVKGTTLEMREGNSVPRIVETPAGILNAIGLQNPGVEHFLREDLPYLMQFDLPVIVNIAGNTVDEYAVLAGRLEGVEGVAALEVNISCPNVKQGGIAFGTDPKMAYEVIRAVRQSTGLTVIAKLSPNVTDIAAMAKSVEEAGADAISLINTLLGMAIDIHSRRPKLANIVGGLSGPAVKPVALRMVWQVAKAVKVPVIGMGGIMNAEDAIEFLLAGATAIAVGTANFVNPRATVEIIEGIEEYMRQNHLTSIVELIGGVCI